LRRAFFPLCLLLTAILLACILLACGGSNSAMNGQGTSISIVPATPSLRVDDVLQLQAVANSVGTSLVVTPPTGTWSSSDTGIVKVNPNGLLFGISPGNATVNFACSICQGVFVGVTVTPRATSLAISPLNANVNSGSTFQFDASGVIDGTEQEVTNLAVWTLDNSLMGNATIVAGLLSINPGAVMQQTVIQVTVSYGGLKASAPVFVNP
jgi:hypothetical protein